MKKKLIAALLGILLFSSIGANSMSILSGGEDLPPVHKMSVEEPDLFS